MNCNVCIDLPYSSAIVTKVTLVSFRLKSLLNSLFWDFPVCCPRVKTPVVTDWPKCYHCHETLDPWCHRRS